MKFRSIGRWFPAFGTGWDRIAVTGSLDIQATSGNKVTITLTSIDAD